MQKKKVMLYCRVAADNYENSKLTKQGQHLRNFAEKQNYEIVETVKEHCSGTNLDRPGINRIHEIVECGGVEAIIAENISRYGRCSLRKIADFVESLKEKKVPVLTIDNGNLKNILPILKLFS